MLSIWWLIWEHICLHPSMGYLITISVYLQYTAPHVLQRCNFLKIGDLHVFTPFNVCIRENSEEWWFTIHHGSRPFETNTVNVEPVHSYSFFISVKIMWNVEKLTCIHKCIYINLFCSLFFGDQTGDPVYVTCDQSAAGLLPCSACSAVFPPHSLNFGQVLSEISAVQPSNPFPTKRIWTPETMVIVGDKKNNSP